jgi:FkbM family methyltransferase
MSELDERKMNGSLKVFAKKILLRALQRPNMARYLHRTVLFAHQNPVYADALFSDEYRFIASIVAHGENSVSQIFQDLWVLFETASKSNGFFVEFGATDGRTISNTYILETRFGWNGILAEPAPIWHERLHNNRKCHLSEKCVWKASGELLAFNVIADTGYSTVAAFAEADLHSDARQVAKEINVETITLDDLLDSFNAPEIIDFMSIDTEGSELEILRSFEFSKRKVRLICVEHNGTANEALLDELLVRNGFERRFPQFSMFDGWYRNVEM